MLSKKPVDIEACREDQVNEDELTRQIPQVVGRLVKTCQMAGCYEHVTPVPIPSLQAVIEVLRLARNVLFPGYFSPSRIDQVSLEYYLGQEVTNLFHELSKQIAWAFRHDCYRHQKTCVECELTGGRLALRFIEKLPDLRIILASDIKAARDGDPANQGVDEIIFSYPGMRAVSIHRLAHVLYHLEVPLLPRIMNEYAHSQTGIDIHPGAHIGESFFIDHGTGVVIGETCHIGDRVRIYQGVTLGALSLPADAGRLFRGKKRHPTIEDDVIIYSGATILGGETVIGARSIIGGNVWLTESVPPDTKVIHKNPELVYLGNQREAGNE